MIINYKSNLYGIRFFRTILNSYTKHVKCYVVHNNRRETKAIVTVHNKEINPTISVAVNRAS